MKIKVLKIKCAKIKVSKIKHSFFFSGTYKLSLCNCINFIQVILYRTIWALSLKMNFNIRQSFWLSLVQRSPLTPPFAMYVKYDLLLKKDHLTKWTIDFFFSAHRKHIYVKTFFIMDYFTLSIEETGNLGLFSNVMYLIGLLKADIYLSIGLLYYYFFSIS